MRILCALALLGACATTNDRTAELAAKREVTLARLHDYMIAGEFPADSAGMPASIFRDAAGRECPMASLITQSGHDDLVSEVVAKNNELRLADVTEGPLMDWILDSGLTKDEVVMIQGAMNIDYSGIPLNIETPNGGIYTAAAQHKVRDRLRKIEGQLRVATPNSIEQITRIERPKQPSTAPVVPERLVKHVTVHLRR